MIALALLQSPTHYMSQSIWNSTIWTMACPSRCLRVNDKQSFITLAFIEFVIEKLVYNQVLKMIWSRLVDWLWELAKSAYSLNPLGSSLALVFFIQYKCNKLTSALSLPWWMLICQKLVFLRHFNSHRTSLNKPSHEQAWLNCWNEFDSDEFSVYL